jgi:hypothetical protein
MQELEALKAAVPGFIRRKGRSGSRISALEAAYEKECRFVLVPDERCGDGGAQEGAGATSHFQGTVARSPGPYSISVVRCNAIEFTVIYFDTD